MFASSKFSLESCNRMSLRYQKLKKNGEMIRNDFIQHFYIACKKRPGSKEIVSYRVAAQIHFTEAQILSLKNCKIFK